MRIWAFAVRRWQFTLVLFGLLIAVGVNAYLNIPRSEDPEFHAPFVTIVAVYPGADPADIERLVVDPIEDAINELDDIKSMDSRSMDGVGVVQVEFHWHTDPDDKYDETVREVTRVRAALPADLASLEIRKAGSGLVNIVQLALVSESADYRQLEKLAEDLADSLEAAPGVRRSESWAYPEPELRVAIDLERMGRARVTLGQLEAAIRGENASIPGGSVDVGLRKFNLRTSGSYDSVEEIAQTVVASSGGRIVRVRDVATVGWADGEERHLGRYKGERAVFVTASAKDAVNVFAVRDAIYARLDAFEARLPEGVRLERGFDQTRNVDHRLTRLGVDFAIAIGLVLLTLIPLGLRASLVVMISIPLSLAIGVAALHFSGFSLNQLSIAGFVLSLGLLVDDSIVVVENISRYLRAGYSRVEAAIAATDQIALAVLGCTATLILAFLPLLFLPEGAGKFIRSLPVTVFYTVLASMFVALTVIPVPRQPPAAPGGRDRAWQSCTAGVDARDPHGLLAGPAGCARPPAQDAAGCAGLRGRVVRTDSGHRREPVPARRHPAVPHRHRDPTRREPRGHRPCGALRRAGARRAPRGQGLVRQRRPRQSADLLQHLPRGDERQRRRGVRAVQALRSAPHAQRCSRNCARSSTSIPVHASSSSPTRTDHRSMRRSRSACRGRSWPNSSGSRSTSSA